MTLEVGLTEDLALCHALRRLVFIEEQNVPEADEVDGRDAGALHLLARFDGKAVGCARVLIDGDTAKIGRVCVLRSWRGKGIGVALMQTTLEVLRRNPDIAQAKLGAQIHAIGFYANLGFQTMGVEYLDAGILHRDMVITLSESP